MSQSPYDPINAHAMAAAQRLTPRSRGGTFTFLSGLLMGALAIGLIMPYLVGRDPRDFASDPTAAGSFGFDEAGAGAPAEGVDGMPAEVGDEAVPGTADPGAPGGDATSAGGTGAGTGASTGTGSGGGTGTGGASVGGSNTPSGPLTASDRGVTAKTIKVGVILPDLSGLSAIGVKVGSKDPQGKAQSAIDSVNSSGGILGRKIVPVYRKVDVIDQNKMRQGCLSLANDDKVFAVVNFAGFYGQAVRCLTAETKTPFITAPSYSVTDHRASGGNLITLDSDSTGLMASLAYDLGRAGLLKKKIGVITQAGYDEGTKAGFIPVAKSMGAKIVSVYTVANDLNTAGRQVPLAVAQFQRDGVETVLLDVGGDNGSNFVRTSDSQGARWNYEGGCCIANIDQAPDSFFGTHWIGSFHQGEAKVGLPANRLDKKCVDTYARRSYADKTGLSDRDNTNYASATAYCALFEVFADGARTAGANLTRSGLAATFPKIPAKEYPFVVGPVSFRGGYNDGADYHRITVADKSCKCFHPVNNGRPLANKY